MSERPIWANDTIYSDITIEYGFWDRVKILLFGKSFIQLEIHCQNRVGQIDVNEKVIV